MTKELQKKIWDNGWEYHEWEDGQIEVEIGWGDWKHDHIFCDHIMRENGYTLINEVVTEEDGSDCYSSIHYYKKFTLEDLKNLLELRKKMQMSIAD